MKCLNCGTEVPEGAKNCSVCGTEVEAKANLSELLEPNKESHENGDIKDKTTPTNQNASSDDIDIVIQKIKAFWNKMDLFCRIETVAITIVSLLLIISIIIGNVLPIIISIAQFCGLIFALLLHKERIKHSKKWLKHLILVIAIVLVAINISSYTWFGFKDEVLDSFVKISTPYKAEECINKNKDMVIDDFRKVGFSNIIVEKLCDLDVDESERNELVENVSINGVTNFLGNEEFKKSSQVVVRYHSYKKVKVPVSYDEALNMDPDQMVKVFEKAGFLNVTNEEVFDLDPDMITVEFNNSISINGEDFFGQQAEFPIDAHVIITTHKPFEKHNLKVLIDFTPNILFNRYDVDFCIDGHFETLTHGEDAQFEYKLKEGEYSLSFESTESSDVEGTVVINLTGDTEVSYKIDCYGDEIAIKTLYIENLSAVGENEAMVPISASDCKFENYNDIEKRFMVAGFTNISKVILYDIVLGWTEEGEVERVSINGNTDFNRGNVFDKDAEIVITYHMSEKDNPEKKSENDYEVELPKKTQAPQHSITIENNEAFATLMSITDQTDTLTIKSFVNSHIGDVVEFDGCVAFMMNHKNYKTRFDVCLVGGDYSGNRVYGPLFAFENVNYSEMNVSGVDSVSGGMDFRISGEIMGFNDDGNYIVLNPIFMKLR